MSKEKGPKDVLEAQENSGEERSKYEKMVKKQQSKLHEKTLDGIDLLVHKYNGVDRSGLAIRRNDEDAAERILQIPQRGKRETMINEYSSPILDTLLQRKLVSQEEIIQGDAYLENGIRDKINSPDCSVKERDEYANILKKLQKSFVVADTTQPKVNNLSWNEKTLRGAISGKSINIQKIEEYDSEPPMTAGSIEGKEMSQDDAEAVLGEYFEIGEIRQKMLDEIVKGKIRDVIFPRIEESKRQAEWYEQRKGPKKVVQEDPKLKAEQEEAGKIVKEIL
jgi:hypothetical protein